MSSLITSASTWISNETPKKRIPTMRKTMKKRSNDIEQMDEPDYGKLKMNSIEELQNISDERSQRVNDLLNQMTNAGNNDNDDKFGDFVPISPPTIQSKKDIQSIEHSKEYNPSVSTYLEASTSRKYKANNDNVDYGANDNGNDKLSNYNKSYEAPAIKPYYANMGISTSNNNGKTGSNDKLMERINYMIHLLEAQQHEKTDNITEEFLLYTFLGVFVIFVVDSFAKTGTYKR